MPFQRSIRRAQSLAADPHEAVSELFQGLWQEDTALVVFFCSNHYDLDSLTIEINKAFAGIQVIGCTTAGEIGPSGYLSHTLSGVSFPAEQFSIATGRLDNLQKFDYSKGYEFSRSLLHRLASDAPIKCDYRNSFGFLLVDGLSAREEIVARSFQNGIGRVSLVGGSAGDDMQFHQTAVFHDGAFHTDSAVLALIKTPLRFKIFKTQHFERSEERFVVTEAIPEHRIVKEINGFPAAREYARLIGIPYNELQPVHFATNPVVIVIGGTSYVRSIRCANPDESLSFFCAIEEGVVLRLGHGADLIGKLEGTFQTLREDIGQPQLVLLCDCILRNLEMTKNGQTEGVSNLLRDNCSVGFSSYGEQFQGVHVNQTLTGVAIGSGVDHAL